MCEIGPPYRKIIIYGVEEGVFGRFLRFLYGAAVEPDSMALEELVDLLAVADRWVGQVGWLGREVVAIAMRLS